MKSISTTQHSLAQVDPIAHMLGCGRFWACRWLVSIHYQRIRSLPGQWLFEDDDHGLHSRISVRVFPQKLRYRGST